MPWSRATVVISGQYLQSYQHKTLTSMALSEEEKLAKRRERFAGTPKVQHGLVSRGEDSLRRDAKARRDFYNDVRRQLRHWSKIKQLIDEDPTLEDTLSEHFGLVQESPQKKSSTNDPDILLNLRKLREAVLGLSVGENSPGDDLELSLSVHVLSYRIGILADHAKTYWPSLQWLYQYFERLNSSNSGYETGSESSGCRQNEVLRLYIVILADENVHRAYQVMGHHHLLIDASLSLYIRSMASRNLMALNHAINLEQNVYVKRLMRSKMKLDMTSTTTSTKTTTKCQEIISESLGAISKAYFQLAGSELEKLTGMVLEDLLKHQSWVLQGSTVVIRTRGARKK